MGYLHIDNLYKNQTIRLFRECYALEKVLASIQAERDELRSACDKRATASRGLREAASRARQPSRRVGGGETRKRWRG